MSGCGGEALCSCPGFGVGACPGAGGRLRAGCVVDWGDLESGVSGQPVRGCRPETGLWRGGARGNLWWSVISSCRAGAGGAGRRGYGKADFGGAGVLDGGAVAVLAGPVDVLEVGVGVRAEASGGRGEDTFEFVAAGPGGSAPGFLVPGVARAFGFDVPGRS